MRTAHLLATLVTCVTLAAALGGANWYAQSVEERYVHVLAPKHATVNVTGSVLQKIAFQQPDLLPIYGGSEVELQDVPTQPSRFFQNYPTGFETFEVSRGGALSLNSAEALAAIGDDLRGKKVVISFAPSDFLIKQEYADAYAASFSRLHANELVFSFILSYSTKQRAARRMLQYPDTLTKDPILRFALQNLADDSLLNHLLYEAVWPLGKLQSLIMEFQDQYETIHSIDTQTKGLQPDVKRGPAIGGTANPDWKTLALQAQHDQIPTANNNPYGFDNDLWQRHFAAVTKLVETGKSDAGYIAMLENSQEWLDFDILMRVLKDMGAQPLLLGRPIKAVYMEATGVSLSAQQVFYAKLRQIAQQYGLPVVDFKSYQNDQYFGVDSIPHTSQVGWVHVDQILAQFYHGALH